MSKLSKSLSELDAMADELLAKSVKKSESEEDELKPEDVSENVPEDEVEETEETKEEEETAEVEKEEASEDEVKKSEDVENLEKGCDGKDCANGDDISKAEEEPEEEDENENEAEEKADLEKSFQSEFNRNPDIQQSIDASAFLSAVTEIFSKSMADVCYDIRKNANEVNGSSEILAKSLQASLQLNKSMAEEISLLKSQNAELRKGIEKSFNEFRDFMEDRFEAFSHEPTSMRKSLGSVNVAERNFAKSLDLGAGVQLSKSEVLAKMNNMLMSGNPIITAQDVISYESGAPLRPEISQLIYNN